MFAPTTLRKGPVGFYMANVRGNWNVFIGECAATKCCPQFARNASPFDSALFCFSCFFAGVNVYAMRAGDWVPEAHWSVGCRLNVVFLDRGCHLLPAYACLSVSVVLSPPPLLTSRYAAPIHVIARVICHHLMSWLRLHMTDTIRYSIFTCARKLMRWPA